MRHTILHLWLVKACLMLVATTSFADKNTDQTIRQLYHSLQINPTSSMAARLDFISQQWLYHPYERTALGEGTPSAYDEAPRYRTDAFDCETYVDTVLAAAFATDLPSFKQCMDQIRYANGRVSYVTRNHFTSLDWNTNNQKQGFIKDITETIVNHANQPVAIKARALIDKAAWYKFASPSQIRLLKATPIQQAHQLTLLKRAGSQFKKQTDIISYIPLTVLFDKQGRPNLDLFKQIPNGAIIEIIRPNWDLTQEIGTHLNVSHLGFVFWKNNILLFRNATSSYQHVIDIPLITYLREAQQSPTIGGINIQIVLPHDVTKSNSTCPSQ